MATNSDTVRNLCKSIITRMENQKLIEFQPRLRQGIADEVYALVVADIVTEEEIRNRALEKMSVRAEALNDSGLAENDQFKAAKANVTAQLGDDVLHGLYFQAPLVDIGRKLAGFFMKSKNIEEVFDSDDVIARRVVEMIQKFNPSDQH